MAREDGGATLGSQDLIYFSFWAKLVWTEPYQVPFSPFSSRCQSSSPHSTENKSASITELRRVGASLKLRQLDSSLHSFFLFLNKIRNFCSLSHWPHLPQPPGSAWYSVNAQWWLLRNKLLQCGRGCAGRFSISPRKLRVARLRTLQGHTAREEQRWS